MSSKRRGRGEGGIRKRADGRWEAILDLGIVDGRRRSRSFYGKTRADVSRKLREAQQRYEEGQPVLDARMTLSKWLDHWVTAVLPNRVANDTLQPSTADSYDDTVRLHLKPGLGHHRLTRLTPEHVDEFIAWKRTQMHGKQNKPYSASSLRLMRTTLRKALQDAQKAGRVTRNVAALSETVHVPKGAEKYLTLDEARRLLVAIADERLHALYCVALCLGLRRGEVLGLRWEDVNLGTGEIRIARQLRRVRNRPESDGSYPDGRKTRLEFKHPKTPDSIATLTLPETALVALRRHRAEQAAERLAAKLWLDDSLVFATPYGTPIDPDNLWTHFSKVCTAAGLGHRNPRQLRHSAATILLGRGVPLHEVKDTLRHSSVSVTKDVYGHFDAERKRAVADVMDAALRGPEPDAYAHVEP